jgi:DNA (cytosine-5)-methyltransferase 1
MRKKLNVIDLFCGSGGLSYGFAKNDVFNVICAVDNDADMINSYQINHSNTKAFEMDVADFTGKFFEKNTSYKISNIDIIVGGPPCQAYSTLGRAKLSTNNRDILEDPRGKLFQEYYRILKIFKPKLFIFENVRGLLSMGKGQLVKQIVVLFEELGYTVKLPVLNAMNYGVPQHRNRIIITGTLFKTEFKYPESTHGNSPLLPYLTLKDAFSDLPEIGNNDSADYYAIEPQNEYQKWLRKNSGSILTEHSYPKNSDRLIKFMNIVPEGGNLMDIPKDIRPQKSFNNSYSRLWWNKPATTITSNFGAPSSARCVHPTSCRALTTREGARLQSYPDDYIFTGSKNSKNLQIGNSVPPLLAIALSNSVAKHFNL